MRLQLILSFVLIVLVSVAGVAFIASQGAASEVRSFMFQGSMIRAQEIASQLEDYYQQNQTFAGAEDLMDLKHPGGGQGMGQGMMNGFQNMMGQRLRLADAEGLVLIDTTNPQPAEILTKDMLARAIPLKAGLSTIGYLLPESAMIFTASEEQFLVSRLTRAALIAGLVAGGIAFALAFILAYRLLAPVRSLTQAARVLAQGDFSQRVAVKGNDELAQLGKTFNQMADSLQEAQESRRAMTADIAHELRTPLAVQLANLEALQDGIYPLTPESLEPMLENNRLLSRLVEDLRTLALADGGQLKLEPGWVDIQLLVRRVAEAFRTQASAQEVQIVQAQATHVDHPMAWADAGRLEQILTNLLSNALRYTPPGGRIELGISSTTAGIKLTVRDTGPGIPPEALAHIFERFYRADRSRNRQEGGSGLGLAIARQLTQLHGGSLEVANHAEGGAVFTLSLPIPEESHD